MPDRLKESSIIELAVIGGGPAGISAAIQAKKLGLRVILIEANKLGGSLWAARRIDNLPPLPPMRGFEISQMFSQRFMDTGLDWLNGAVETINLVPEYHEGFEIRLSTGHLIYAEMVILATGQVPHLPEQMAFLKGKACFPGEINPERLGRGKKVAVVGGGEVALDQAIFFYDGGAEVTIFTRSELKINQTLLSELKRTRIVVRQQAKIVSAEEEGGLLVLTWISSGQQFTSEKFHLVMIALGKKPSPPEIKDNSWANIEAAGFGEFGETVLTGMFVAGDLKNGRSRYVSLAVSDGIKAAIKACEYIKSKRRVK
jgi:thioredoxin reductase (NADPH)